MGDFFWLSPTQGDLSDVVRASLQPPPPPPNRRLPTPPVCSHTSLGVQDLSEEEDELMLLQEGVNSCGDDDDHDQVSDLQQVVHGDGVGSSNGVGSCGHVSPLSSPASYPLREVLETKGDAAAPQELDKAIAPHPHAPPIKRRKSQTKKVVCIPAPTAAPPGASGRGSTSGEVVPSDLWAWRKYGQKPIKGSPYPRGYYRCSSSKGCSARKQVERSRTDPSMLVITYTSDHNHPWPTQRNVLAGSARQHHSSSAKSHHRHRSSVHAATPPLSFKKEQDHQPTPGLHGVAPEHEPDMLGGAISIPPTPSKKQQLFSEKLTEEGDKQQLLDPFSFSLFDWVGASFGIGDANKGGCT